MSKGLYLVARKIASRWEYAPEWEGGDPTAERGGGLPKKSAAASGVNAPGSSDHGHYDNMDVDSPAGQRRQRGGGGQRSRGGRGDRGDELDSYGSRYDRDRDGGRDRERDRDGGGRGMERDGGGRGGDRRGGDRSGGGRESRFSRPGREQTPDSGPMPGSRSQGQVHPTALNPWVDPALLATVVGSAAGVPPVGSAEAWQRLLGQIPTSARESLGIPAQLTQAPSATDVYAQVVAQQQQQQPLQQAPQVGRLAPVSAVIRYSRF